MVKVTPPIERALRRIAIPDPVKGCWVWQSTTLKGYGIIGIGPRSARRTKSVHVLVWEHYYGSVPDGLDLDHLCRCRACCNPDHLEPVSRGENCIRGANGAMSLVCHNGHWKLGDNVYAYLLPSGGWRRSCKLCVKENSARRERTRDRKAERERRQARSSVSNVPSIDHHWRSPDLAEL